MGLALAMTLVIHPVWKTELVRADDQIEINETNFEDPNFREYISDKCDWNSDGFLSAGEISYVNSLSISNKQIKNLKGIEYFTELTTLSCSNNQLTELDVSKNTKLKELNCYSNQLASLNLGSNPNLVWLSCNDNALTSLDVSKNAELKNIYCSKNPISSIDLSNNPKVESLYVSDTSLTSLDLSTCTNLKKLSCERTTLTSLNLEKCTALEYATVLSNHDLTSLVMGNNENLWALFCQYNALTSIDVSGLPNLSSFQVNNNQLTEIDVSQNPHLKIFYCGHNQISELGVSQNPELETLVCEVNQLTSLDVSACEKLKSISCEYNQLSELDLSHNPNLTSLQCQANNIVELDLSYNPNLEKLKCQANNIEELDIHACPLLVNLVQTAERVVMDVAQYQGENGEWLFIDTDVPIRTEPAVYTVNVSTDGNGTAAASASSGTRGDQITLTATPNEGYRFKAWQVISGDVTITDNTFVIGKKDVEIKAIFEAIPTPDPDPLTPEPGPTTPEPGPTTPEPGPTTPEPGPTNPDPSNPNPDPSDPQPGTPDPAKDPSFEDFVERLYTVALGRASEAEGKAFWVDQVVNKGFTGADCARFFLLDAPEFLGRGLTDDQFVEILYKTFFDRESEADGKAYWLGRLASGSPKADVVNDFIESVEWCNVCATYGVKSGAKWHKATIASKNAIKFATRLYTCCLGREPEADGLNYWSLALTNLEVSGYQAASLFFESPEFQGFNTSNEEYLTRLYTTFMGREPDADGFNYWLGLLNGGMSRSDALKTFAGCPEFQEICNKYGIDRGVI